MLDSAQLIAVQLVLDVLLCWAAAYLTQSCLNARELAVVVRQALDLSSQTSSEAAVPHCDSR